MIEMPAYDSALKTLAKEIASRRKAAMQSNTALLLEEHHLTALLDDLTVTITQSLAEMREKRTENLFLAAALDEE